MNDIERKVNQKLRDRGALDGGREVIFSPYGREGIRVSIVRPEGKKTVDEKSISISMMRGSMNDRVNGIVGRLLNPGNLREGE